MIFDRSTASPLIQVLGRKARLDKAVSKILSDPSKSKIVKVAAGKALTSR